jgi:hypothetical protein
LRRGGHCSLEKGECVSNIRLEIICNICVFEVDDFYHLLEGYQSPSPPTSISYFLSLFFLLNYFFPLLSTFCFIFTLFSSHISLYFFLSCGELSAGSDSREEEESFYKKRKSQLNVIFSVLGTPVEVTSEHNLMNNGKYDSTRKAL